MERSALRLVYYYNDDDDDNNNKENGDVSTSLQYFLMSIAISSKRRI